MKIIRDIWSAIARLLGRATEELHHVHPVEIGGALVNEALRKRAAGHEGHLDPVHSVEDLLKTLDMPSDLKARAALAEAFAPGRPYTGKDGENEWLLNAVMTELRDPRAYRRLVSGK